METGSGTFAAGEVGKEEGIFLAGGEGTAADRGVEVGGEVNEV